MAVRIQCPNPECGKKYKADESLLGRTMTCRQCGQEFTVSRGLGETSAPSADEGTARVAMPVTPARDVLSKIGRFEIRSRIGAGAFGTVYRAHDPVLDREVALKVPRAAVLEKPEARARFLREPKAAAQLRHPHIVPVYDAGVDGDRYYIASAYIEGRTLEEVIAEERPEFRRAARIVSDLAAALDYAHRKGVVHRDVKPANIMIDRQGQALLMDFGLARLESSEEKLTQDGSLMGTPAYMAPEQADGSLGEVGPASDQYGLGVVLYEALCGQTPFSGPPSVLIFNAIHQEPPAPSSLDPEIPRDLETICLKAMAKRAGERYANCGAMADDLRRWLAGTPIWARRVGPVERAVGWCRRNRALAALSAVSIVLLLTVAIVVIGRRNAEPVPSSSEEIPQFYEFINDAWARGDLAGIAGRVSEEGAAMVLDIGGEERLVDAQGYRKLVQDADLARSGIVSHVVRPVKVVQYGDSATVWTRTDERLKDGQDRSMRAFQVLGRYGSGWRIVLHLPDLADFVVEITEVQPTGQAQRVDLRVGDHLVSYAGEPINNPDDLVRLTKLKTSDRGIPLVVRRGDQEMSLDVDGGELGVRPTGFIVPKEETVTSGPEVEAIAQMFDELAAAVRKRGVTAQKDFFYDAAVALVADPNPGVLSGDELVRALDEDLPNADPGSFRFTEVRALVSGRVALAQTANRMLLKSGQEFSNPAIHGLFKEDGRWRIFAVIPPFFTIHPDVPAHLGEEPTAEPPNDPNGEAGESAGIDQPGPPEAAAGAPASSIPGSAFLGVSFRDVTPELARELRVSANEGVAIHSVFANTPADDAGLAENDVILSFNGQPVQSSEVLVAVIRGSAPGSRHQLEVLRGGRRLSLDLVLAAREAPKVISTVPANGETDVDPGLKTIQVVFDRPMKDSFSMLSSGPQGPKIAGQPAYDSTHTVWTIPVEFRPKWTHVFTLNTDRHKGFQSQQGVPLEPVTVTFTTGAK